MFGPMLDRIIAAAYIARHDDDRCSFEAPPPPRHPGAGARLVVTPVPPDQGPRHFSSEHFRAVGLAPVVR
jgi:hypothetical protein